MLVLCVHTISFESSHDVAVPCRLSNSLDTHVLSRNHVRKVVTSGPHRRCMQDVVQELCRAKIAQHIRSSSLHIEQADEADELATNATVRFEASFCTLCCITMRGRPI